MSEIEEQAKAQGWNPDYKGDNAKTAQEFLEAGKTIAPIAAERNAKLAEELAAIKANNEALLGEFKSFRDQQFKVNAESEKRGYEKALKDIKARQRKAVEDGDTEEFDKLEQDKENLKKPEPIVKVEEPKIDPEFNVWHKDNPWYKIDGSDDLSLAAETYASALSKRRPDLKGKDFYKQIEKHIKTIFSDEFKSSQPKLDTSTHTQTQSKGKNSYDDLPKDAKAACNDQVKKGWCTKEEYAKNYFEAMGA